MAAETDSSELLTAVEAALADAAHWPRAVELLAAAGAPVVASGRLGERLVERHRLTPTELRVLEHIIAGRDPNGISEAEGIAVATVRTHIAHLHDKFGVNRTIDVLRLALVEGMREQ